jgi:hypothetical protein
MASVANTQKPLELATRFEKSVFHSPDGSIVTNIIRFDNQAADVGLVVDWCSSSSANNRAAAERASAGESPDWDTAVYIASPINGFASKIGVSRDLPHRLSLLQTGSCHPLEFSHLFWMKNKAAFGIEAIALRVMSRLGKRLAGEWVDANPEEAASAVAAVLLSSSVSFSSSGMFLKNTKNAFYSHDDYATSGRARMHPEDVILARLDKEGLTKG